MALRTHARPDYGRLGVRAIRSPRGAVAVRALAYVDRVVTVTDEAVAWTGRTVEVTARSGVREEADRRATDGARGLVGVHVLDPSQRPARSTMM
jgi:hypothetical protein